jgi:hypothetical protein
LLVHVLVVDRSKVSMDGKGISDPEAAAERVNAALGVVGNGEKPRLSRHTLAV